MAADPVTTSNIRNFGGWKGCDLRYDVLGSTDVEPDGYGTWLTISASDREGYDASETAATNPVSDTLMSCLPSELRAVMKPITKYTDNTGNASGASSDVTASVDYLPLLAEYEVFGSNNYANTYEQNYQKQYDYYANGNSKIKYKSTDTGTSVAWWARSPSASDSYGFCRVSYDGSAAASSAYLSFGLAPVFLV